MNKTKRISIMALSAALAVCSVASLPASAYEESIYSYDNPFYSDSEITYIYPYNNGSGVPYIDAISYRILENGTYEDTVYVDPDELENGDYTFQAGLYLEADTADLADILHFHAHWDGLNSDGTQAKYITTGNVATYGYQWNDDKTNMMLDEIYSSFVNYVDYTYTGLDNIFSAGPYKILYINDDEEEIIYDLTVDEKTGEAFTIIEEEWYENTNGKYGYLKIPHYDPETPYGNQFAYEENYADIHCLSKRANAWINEVTGDNQMAKFDVTIDQDTPEGVYYVGFRNTDRNAYNYMSGNGKTFLPSNLYAARTLENPHVFSIFHNDHDYWLKIVVGGTEEEKAVTAEETYDVNQDGAIGLADASGVLTTYAERAAGTASGIQLLKSVAADYDIDGDGEISVSDATEILTKYARKASGLE